MTGGAKAPFGLSVECQTGQRVHRLLALWARLGERPDCECILRDAKSLLKVWPFVTRFKPGPQRIATLAAIGLRHFPPITWRFVSAEMPAGDGRVDLAWRDPTIDMVMFDEYKIGSLPGQLTTPDTSDQVRRYLRFGDEMFGDRFLGVRLIALSSPRRSVLVQLDGKGERRQCLAETPYWFASIMDRA